MVQITATLSSLTKSEREHLAAFILAYPLIALLAADKTEEPEDEPASFTNFPIADEEPAPVGDAEAAAMFGATLAGDAEAAAIFGSVATSLPNVPLPVTIPSSPAPAAGPVLVPNPPAPAGIVAEPAASNLDKSGLPWDERIHASSKAKTADGSWRKKRGIDDATVAQVEAELKTLMAIPGTAQPIPAPPTPTLVPAAPVAAAVVEDRQAYVNLLSMASAAILGKTLTTEQLNAAVISVGVPTLPLLANRLDLVPQVAAAIKAITG